MSIELFCVLAFAIGGSCFLAGYAFGYRMREEQLKIDIDNQVREAMLRHPSAKDYRLRLVRE